MSNRFFLEVKTETSKPNPTTVGCTGGKPFLPAGHDWPCCGDCDENLTLYFQLELLSLFGLPFQAGSRLLVFCCTFCNEPALEELEWPVKLPGKFWESFQHHKLFLLPPSLDNLVGHPMEPNLVFGELYAERRKENLLSRGGLPCFKVAEAPRWLQEPRPHICCCGAAMSFICQLPEDYGFAVENDAPRQRSNEEDYLMFGGTDTLIFACVRQCHPNSVMVVNQR